MATEKIFAGAVLRETRSRAGLAQRGFAERLGISLPYLSQMENNHRPVSAGVLLRLSSEFGVDLASLGANDTTRIVSDLQEALADPLFDATPSPSELRLAAANAPGLTRAFLDLYRIQQQSRDRLAALDVSLDHSPSPVVSPWEDVRDFFHYCDNYIDAVDRTAERFARKAGTSEQLMAHAVEALEAHGIHIRFQDLSGTQMSRKTKDGLTINRHAPLATQRFLLLHQVALSGHSDLLDATLDLARFRSDTARRIARIGLANYFAGAALLPYERFLEAANTRRHDLDLLATDFGASIEQVAHRLSTLQRPGAKGVAFFFVRVDQAGTITKRHSATRLQFARFGGACPLWNVHQAFEQPGRYLRQVAQTPDGVRYLCLARDVSKPAPSFRAPVRRLAIGLGCEISHAQKLVYADGLDVTDPALVEPIGISCRICPRMDCHQRSLPPIDADIQIAPDRTGPLPYRLA